MNFFRVFIFGIVSFLSSLVISSFGSNVSELKVYSQNGKMTANVIKTGKTRTVKHCAAIFDEQIGAGKCFA